MRERLAASSMMDTASFAREMERIYTRIVATES
jgi:hypothetical protein